MTHEVSGDRTCNRSRSGPSWSRSAVREESNVSSAASTDEPRPQVTYLVVPDVLVGCAREPRAQSRPEEASARTRQRKRQRGLLDRARLARATDPP